MRIHLLAGIAVLLTSIGVLVLAAPAQFQSSVPYDRFMAPLYSIEEGSYLYPSTYRSLRAINFRNFSLHVGGDGIFVPPDIPLKGGRYVKRDDLLYYETNLEGVHYFTPRNAPGEEYALLLLEDFSCGGSCSSADVAQVVQLLDHKLRIVQEISASTDYGGPFFPHPFSESTKTLVLYSAHYMPGDAHCCVSAMDVVTLKWNGSRFVQTSIDMQLTDYGRNQGKKLTR